MPFSQIRSKVQHLIEALELEGSQGILKMGLERFMLLPAASFGFLRRELVVTLGQELARGVLKRYGFQAGFADGHSLCRLFPGLALEEQMVLGTLLHEKEGVVRVETDRDLTRIDLEAGLLELHAYWHDSVEAAQHLEQIGPSAEPACWSLAGYASGHLGYLFQRDVIAIEKTCVAQGHKFCTLEVGFREPMEQRYPGCYHDFQSLDLVQKLNQLHDQLSLQGTVIQKLKSKDFLAVSPVGPFDRLLGNSIALEKARNMGRAVAAVDSTILITGQSGTGKELMARAIHETSPRARKDFVAINCATLGESLQNAQLFGYVRGAFTGAQTDRPGLFETADGGTLFLDEVGELQPSAQAALLRVLQEGRLSRIGETRERKVNVRIIAATHRRLQDMVTEGLFRQDLFFRLYVVNLHMPSLSERENDILLLARFFLELYAVRFNRKIEGLDSEVIRLFLKYPWPGNVRELQNTMERAVLLARDSLIHPGDLPECLAQVGIAEVAPSLESAKGYIEPFNERETIETALRKSRGAKARAAEMLGISRATLWRKMKEFNLPGSRSFYAADTRLFEEN